MSQLDETLQRLGMSFTLRDIMVPAERLVCAPAESDAPRISELNQDYNIIPIKDNGVIKAFYERDTKALGPIMVQHLVGSDTSIMDLVDILRTREFCLPLVGNKIGGYVHFSDLNNPLVKLTFYVIFEAFEQHLLAAIHPVAEQEVHRTSGPRRLRRIKKKVEEAQNNRANLRLESPLESFLDLSEILRIAVAKHKLSEDVKRDKSITIFRNRISHAGWPLVENHGDVRTLVQVKARCIAVLNAATPVVST